MFSQVLYFFTVLFPQGLEQFRVSDHSRLSPGDHHPAVATEPAASSGTSPPPLPHTHTCTSVVIYQPHSFSDMLPFPPPLPPLPSPPLPSQFLYTHICSAFRVLRLVRFIPQVRLILWTVFRSLEVLLSLQIILATPSDSNPCPKLYVHEYAN